MLVTGILLGVIYIRILHPGLNNGKINMITRPSLSKWVQA